MASLMNVFEPERLVLGGGLSNVAELYLPRAEDEARARVLPAVGARVRIALADSGARAGLIGAARLAVTEGARAATS
jgi:glucokinase